ncbi:tetratricopeptide repeat protein [uncultured Fibrella sp.]|uniref:tetratricopeptide repeat protein n=1 Tax=uncultured Fibrella sp. TaxID=1284596 RepID=UPI0035C99F5C
MKRIRLLLLFVLVPFLAPAQILTDPAAQQTVAKALDHIYNYEFAEATPYIRQIQVKYPQSPIVPVLRALTLQWQYLPISDSRTVTNQYVQQVELAIQGVEKMIDKNDDDPEAIFLGLTAHGYMSMKHNFDNETMKAVSESRKAYVYMKDGFNLLDKNVEFYFSTGLYNYYVERYPIDHPAVKPFMFFFKNGNIPLGLKQMEVSATRALFTRPEANLYLAHIYVKHETNFPKAVEHLDFLVDHYPKNPIFMLRYVEALLLAGRYEAGQAALQKLKKMQHKLLPAAIYTFDGILAERMAKNDSAAAVAYKAALKQPVDIAYTTEEHGMSYAGLARIAARANNRAQAKEYYKKALDIAEYKFVIREAKAYK